MCISSGTTLWKSTIPFDMSEAKVDHSASSMVSCSNDEDRPMADSSHRLSRVDENVSEQIPFAKTKKLTTTIPIFTSVKWPTLALILSKLPGVSAGCQLGVSELSLASGSILGQITGQTLLLSIGSTFGGDQTFASDAALALGLLSIGVAGINGMHAASNIFTRRRQAYFPLTDNEREDCEPGAWRYAGLVARLLRLFSTSLTGIVVGMLTCPTVTIGWLAILVLTISLAIYGETYAPLTAYIFSGDSAEPFTRFREDGSSANIWRYNITTYGSYIVHNNTLQSKIVHRRTTPTMGIYHIGIALDRWSGTYFATVLSVATWLWWLTSLQLLSPWTWAPIVILMTGVVSLLLAEWCNSVDSGDGSYGMSKRALTAKTKMTELMCMYSASGIQDLLTHDEELRMNKLIAETLVESGYLNAAVTKYQSGRSVDAPRVIATKFSDIYNIAACLSPTLKHEKDRLATVGNSWPHMGVVEWAIAWTIELADHAVSCTLYISEMKRYHQCNLDPSDATLIACSAISHISCDTVRRFSKEATTVWRQQLWKFAALAQVCSTTHPQLAHRAARCSPEDYQQAIKLWSEYLFGDQSWDLCIVLLAMIRCLRTEGAITYGIYNAKTIAPESLIGCTTSKGDNTTIIWYGEKLVVLNRNIPTPLAAPPRFAGVGRLLPITESAVMAERRILSYIRSSAPHLLGSHAAHALLDLPIYGNSVWQDGDGDPLSEDEFQQPESTQNGQLRISSSEQYTEDNSDI